MNLPVISGRSTRKIPKSSRVPRSPFVIFLVHFFQENLRWARGPTSTEERPQVASLLGFQSLSKNNFSEWTGADRRNPAQTGADRRGPAQTGADRLFSVSPNLTDNYYESA